MQLGIVLCKEELVSAELKRKRDQLNVAGDFDH